MSHRLTFPAPYRISEETGSQQVARQVPVLIPKDKGMRHANNELVLRERLVPQKFFTTRPWEEMDALRLISSGGWFDFSRTEFVDRETKEFALAAQFTQNLLLETPNAP